MKSPARKHLLAVAAGLSLIGTAGCAADTAGQGPADAPAPGDPTSAGTPAPAGTYADGNYSGTGSYIPPSGKSEQVDVELTLADGTVTELEVQASGTSSQSVRYQQEFIDNVQAEVVGRNIDELDVGKVAGSSLTSQGFNQALEQIRSEAAS